MATQLTDPDAQQVTHAIRVSVPDKGLRQDLRAVTMKCRPDWDITTPELKTAWQQGRKELFYPYGKTFVQTLGEQD